MLQIIQKITIYITILLSLFFGYNPENVKATVNSDVTTQSTEISVSIKNETKRPVTQNGAAITAIEKNNDGAWVEIGRVGEVSEPENVFYPTLEQNHTVSLKADFNIDSLTPGEYRLVIPYDLDGTHTAYAYFTVVE